MDEFSLIRRFFTDQAVSRPDVELGIGDDAALLAPPQGQLLVATADTLVAGRHFPDDTDPGHLGHKALAVNLSDLAAMGAEPAWAMLQIALPEADGQWLKPFSDGFLGLAARHGVQLVGGDTVRGPLNIGVQLTGFVPAGQALTRGGARPGDGIYLTGNLGDAALYLVTREHDTGLSTEQRAACRLRLDRPQPRCRQGISLRGIASAAVDVSDGLVADLGHLLAASGTGAIIELDQLPLSRSYRDYLANGGNLDAALGGGDDYELCFTVAARHQDRLEELAASWDCACTRIGVIRQEGGIEWRGAGGYRPAVDGFDHFAS